MNKMGTQMGGTTIDVFFALILAATEYNHGGLRSANYRWTNFRGVFTVHDASRGPWRFLAFL
jgi:hypothetical protein